MSSRWINQKKLEANNISALEAELMKNKQLHAEFKLYLDRLNIQGQLSRGLITDKQASLLFRKIIQSFLKKGLEKKPEIEKAPLRQEDLSNPLNMQVALSNPLSFANKMMSDTTQTIVRACNADVFEDKAETNEDKALLKAHPTATQAAAASALGLLPERKLLEFTIRSFFEKESKPEIQPTEKADSIFKIPTPKPGDIED